MVAEIQLPCPHNPKSIYIVLIFYTISNIDPTSAESWSRTRLFAPLPVIVDGQVYFKQSNPAKPSPSLKRASNKIDASHKNSMHSAARIPQFGFKIVRPLTEIPTRHTTPRKVQSYSTFKPLLNGEHFQNYELHTKNASKLLPVGQYEVRRYAVMHPTKTSTEKALLNLQNTTPNIFDERPFRRQIDNFESFSRTTYDNNNGHMQRLKESLPQFTRNHNTIKVHSAVNQHNRRNLPNVILHKPPVPFSAANRHRIRYRSQKYNDSEELVPRISKLVKSSYHQLPFRKIRPIRPIYKDQLGGHFSRLKNKARRTRHREIQSTQNIYKIPQGYSYHLTSKRFPTNYSKPIINPSSLRLSPFSSIQDVIDINDDAITSGFKRIPETLEGLGKLLTAEIKSPTRNSQHSTSTDGAFRALGHPKYYLNFARSNSRRPRHLDIPSVSGVNKASRFERPHIHTNRMSRMPNISIVAPTIGTEQLTDVQLANLEKQGVLVSQSQLFNYMAGLKHLSQIQAQDRWKKMYSFNLSKIDDANAIVNDKDATFFVTNAGIPDYVPYVHSKPELGIRHRRVTHNGSNQHPSLAIKSQFTSQPNIQIGHTKSNQVSAHVGSRRLNSGQQYTGNQFYTEPSYGSTRPQKTTEQSQFNLKLSQLNFNDAITDDLFRDSVVASAKQTLAKQHDVDVLGNNQIGPVPPPRRKTVGYENKSSIYPIKFLTENHKLEPTDQDRSFSTINTPYATSELSANHPRPVSLISTPPNLPFNYIQNPLERELEENSVALMGHKYPEQNLEYENFKDVQSLSNNEYDSYSTTTPDDTDYFNEISSSDQRWDHEYSTESLLSKELTNTDCLLGYSPIFQLALGILDLPSNSTPSSWTFSAHSADHCLTYCLENKLPSNASGMRDVFICHSFAFSAFHLQCTVYSERIGRPLTERHLFNVIKHVYGEKICIEDQAAIKCSGVSYRHPNTILRGGDIVEKLDVAQGDLDDCVAACLAHPACASAQFYQDYTEHNCVLNSENDKTLGIDSLHEKQNINSQYFTNCVQNER